MDSDGNFTCQCPVSHTGQQCEVDIDECDSSPCLNEASCVDAVSGYTCVCTQGYTGDTCDVGLY